jgi:sortase (surface protein transpeptidase)
MDVNSAIVVDGTLIRTESFLIGITMSTDDIYETQPIGSLSNDYYFGLAAAGISIVDLSSFYMDTSAAYYMEMDFDNNIITWSRGGALLPEAGVFRLEFILLFMGLIGFIFRAVQEAKEERKEVVKYITVISVTCLLIGAGIGSYHVYDELKIIEQNNQVMDSLASGEGNSQYTSGDATFEQEVVTEEAITIVEDTSTEKIVEEVAPNKSIVPADGREYIGVIEVERLGIKLPVLSSYTDADMKTTPCVYYGTRENGNLVIVGHNYNSQFGDFNLLDSKEVITAKLTLVDGSEYEYTSKLIENLEPDQIDEMLTGDWDLTLFTCSYSGEKRIAIRFDLER